MNFSKDILGGNSDLGNGKTKGRSPAKFRFNPNLAVVAKDDVLYDGKP